MGKCNSCSKVYPDAALKKMIHIVERKAYLNYICPSCQAIVHNNPNYYYLVESNK
ncbi:hypothetical protein SYNTR_2232 [Candidatus Syntrophocurvum alkaliphilum]|uniref:Uncharacterized protein n=1 Tax=Candidatus Syntrophocurvum alkaliphilum TaxID=2293317 RepID=A0A6I6DFM1_9FIRM|nr:hypothetical protein [Candidatus Syntrophocurvum alkaliphilum]QGU00826.1 hypothetical protein SYNTR_2232 [Candidatus Syntrophocurvum alkaliphilum]